MLEIYYQIVILAFSLLTAWREVFIFRLGVYLEKPTLWRLSTKQSLHIGSYKEHYKSHRIAPQVSFAQLTRRARFSAKG